MYVVGSVVSISEEKEACKGGDVRDVGVGVAYATNEPPMLLQSSVLYVFMQV